MAIRCPLRLQLQVKVITIRLETRAKVGTAIAVLPFANFDTNHGHTMKLLTFLFGLSASVSRTQYLAAGFGLAALKFAIDSVVLYIINEKFWDPLIYLSPLLLQRVDFIRPAPEEALWMMVFYSLPFAWVGLSMSVRRAATAGVSPWIGAGFLLPGLNFLVIAALSILPSRTDWELETDEKVPITLKSAMLAIGLGVALTMSMVATSVFILGEYGWSLFVATPFVVGAVAGFLTNKDGRSGAWHTIGICILTVLLSAAATMLFALEGVICLVLALPPAIVATTAGGLVGRAVALSRLKSRARSVGILVLLLPFLAGAESLQRDEPEFVVMTAVEIDAAPEEVWPHVVNFTELEPPPEWVQATGIAYPIRARLDGEGVGAVRHCEFSTGAFVEPITAWEPGERLAFDVASQPVPMEEWSPYNTIHPPHLDGYLRSKRGEFRFVRLADGRTRLEGRTWYEVDMAPRFYWSVVVDTLIHRIHLSVLGHVRDEVESGRSGVDDRQLSPRAAR